MDTAAIRHSAQRVLHHVTKAEAYREAGADPAGEIAEARRHLVEAANAFGMFCDPIDDEARVAVEGRDAAE